MRPNVDSPGTAEYECLECGARMSDPDAAVCDRCDAPLRRLGADRDL